MLTDSRRSEIIALYQQLKDAYAAEIDAARDLVLQEEAAENPDAWTQEWQDLKEKCRAMTRAL